MRLVGIQIGFGLRLTGAITDWFSGCGTSTGDTAGVVPWHVPTEEQKMGFESVITSRGSSHKRLWSSPFDFGKGETGVCRSFLRNFLFLKIIT